MSPPPTLAFVTKSYGPDLERCRLLCRSIDALAPPEVAHWLIVDQADVSRFRPLISNRVRLAVTEEIVPARLRRVRAGGVRNVWMTAGAPPLRGWLVQQIAKLAIAEMALEDVLVHVDSDVALIRPFLPAHAVDPDGAIHLYRVDDAIDKGLPNHVRWHRTAEQLLGLPTKPLPLPDYIGHLLPWRRDDARSMLRRVESTTGRPWVQALARAWHMSEYILYGRYADDVLGPTAGHRATSRSLCRSYWHPDALGREELIRFAEESGEDQIAISITAKAGMEPGDYAPIIEKFWGR